MNDVTRVQYIVHRSKNCLRYFSFYMITPKLDSYRVTFFEYKEIIISKKQMLYVVKMTQKWLYILVFNPTPHPPTYLRSKDFS